MVVERKLFSAEEMLSPDTYLSVHNSEIVLTRIKDINIKVALSKDLSDIESMREKLSNIGCNTNYEQISLDHGRTLLIDAPKEVKLFDFSNMHRESPQSQAGYLARYEESGKNLFLIQYLNGTSSRHLHPFSSEAFTVIDGSYFIHDEHANHTFQVPDITSKWVTKRPVSSDHQCFNYGKPAIAIVHLTGPDFHHEHSPMRSLEFLQSKAEKILEKRSGGL